MREIILPLKRTVFLPKGSPGICSVREIKADVRHFEVAAEGGRVFCSGEADLLIEYLSFAPGKQYPGYEDYEQQLSNGGSMWQALLTVPFELTGVGDLPCPPLAKLACGEINWFMVSPHALEMEIEMGLSWQDAVESAYVPTDAEVATAGWQQVTLADVERGSPQRVGQGHNLNTGGMKTKEECKKMEHDDKIMRMGVSDQGWQIVTHTHEAEQPPAQELPIPEPLQTEAPISEPTEPETSILAAAIEEIAQAESLVVEETVVEEICAAEITVEETMVEEVIVAEAITETVTETVVEDPLNRAAPVLNIQTVETAWQPPCEQNTVVEAPVVPTQMERPATRSRAAGLPRLHVRHEQMRSSSYQVNFQIEDEPAQR